MNENDEIIEEKKLLKRIDSLSSDLINLIYQYLNGKSK
jgi:hypothetical protein